MTTIHILNLHPTLICSSIFCTKLKYTCYRVFHFLNKKLCYLWKKRCIQYTLRVKTRFFLLHLTSNVTFLVLCEYLFCLILYCINRTTCGMLKFRKATTIQYWSLVLLKKFTACGKEETWPQFTILVYTLFLSAPPIFAQKTQNLSTWKIISLQ